MSILLQKHGTQKRASGDPYFSHPVEVASMMTELQLDQETIITALPKALNAGCEDLSGDNYRPLESQITS